MTPRERRADLAEVGTQAEILSPGHLARVTARMGCLAPGDRRRYTTRRAHGSHPAGTECYVSRTDGCTLRLEYDDGEVIDVSGYAADIETPIPAEWRLAY